MQQTHNIFHISIIELSLLVCNFHKYIIFIFADLATTYNHSTSGINFKLATTLSIIHTWNSNSVPDNRYQIMPDKLSHRRIGFTIFFHLIIAVSLLFQSAGDDPLLLYVRFWKYKHQFVSSIIHVGQMDVYTSKLTPTPYLTRI